MNKKNYETGPNIENIEISVSDPGPMGPLTVDSEIFA